MWSPELRHGTASVSLLSARRGQRALSPEAVRALTVPALWPPLPLWCLFFPQGCCHLPLHLRGQRALSGKPRGDPHSHFWSALLSGTPPLKSTASEASNSHCGPRSPASCLLPKVQMAPGGRERGQSRDTRSASFPQPAAALRMLSTPTPYFLCVELPVSGQTVWGQFLRKCQGQRSTPALSVEVPICWYLFSM